MDKVDETALAMERVYYDKRIAEGRIAVLERELAKADRRTAEQEGIMAKQRERLEALRTAIRNYIEDTDYCTLCGKSYVCSSGHAQGCILETP